MILEFNRTPIYEYRPWALSFIQFYPLRQGAQALGPPRSKILPI
jgi:hypothetical protein